jgi:phosphatidylinositol alpha-mannosyltransferase
VGGVPEVLDEGRAGRLVPYGDPAALRNALKATVEDPETTRRLMRAAAERVRSYDWSETTGRLRALYREVLAS